MCRNFVGHFCCIHLLVRYIMSWFEILTFLQKDMQLFAEVKTKISLWLNDFARVEYCMLQEFFWLEPGSHQATRILHGDIIKSCKILNIFCYLRLMFTRKWRNLWLRVSSQVTMQLCLPMEPLVSPNIIILISRVCRYGIADSILKNSITIKWQHFKKQKIGLNFKWESKP